MALNGLPGPDPSTLRSVDHMPAGIEPIPLRVSYTSNSVSDYINVKISSGKHALELADPLFNALRKVGKVSNLKDEVTSALAAIGIDGIFPRFTSKVAEYVNSFLPIDAFPKTIGLGLAIYLLKKLYDSNLLLLGYIHHASIEELPNWMGLVEKAKEHPDLSVS